MTSTIRHLLSDIKVSHTIFAMPFALFGAFMATTNETRIVWNEFGLQLMLIVLCMFFARNFAMLSNRIKDVVIDAENPRTRDRAVASGTVSLGKARLVMWVNGGLFVASSFGFAVFWGNLLPFQCSILVLIWLDVYAYMKRLTWLCHLYLGASLALSPVCAVIAIEPAFLREPPIWLLSGAVMCWVAGFDIIYALQDVECDRRDNLKSMPASLGERPAMLISQCLHCVCVALLFGIASVDQSFGWLFFIAVCLIAGLLITEHLTVKKWGTTKIALTFFTLNGIVSVVLGAAGIIDILTKR